MCDFSLTMYRLFGLLGATHGRIGMGVAGGLILYGNGSGGEGDLIESPRVHVCNESFGERRKSFLSCIIA